MSDEPSTLIDSHSYDGIQEFDNPTPAWWHAVFGVSVLWSVLYFVFAQWSPAYVPQTERLQARLDAKQRQMFAGKTFANTESELASLMGDEAWLSLGGSIYRQHCAACHGSAGGGLVGPNLCDESWKNVAVVTDIATVIGEGAAAGAMPAWEGRLSMNEIVLLSAYVASLRGSDPAGVRMPEGDPIPAFPDAIAPEASVAPDETSGA